MAIQETLGGNIVIVQGGDVFNFKGSGAITEGRLVELNTDITDVTTVQAGSANSKAIIGFVEATYEASDQVRVQTGGIARLYNNSGLTISANSLLAAGTSGTIKSYGPLAGSSGTVVGLSLESISTATFGKCLVRPTFNPGSQA